jgi:hypothetical protein
MAVIVMQIIWIPDRIAEFGCGHKTKLRRPFVASRVHIVKSRVLSLNANEFQTSSRNFHSSGVFSSAITPEARGKPL